MPIRASSYSGMDKQEKTIQLDGFESLEKHLSADMSLLIVDDVLDSGRSIEAIIAQLAEMPGPDIQEKVKIAVP